MSFQTLVRRATQSTMRALARSASSFVCRALIAFSILLAPIASAKPKDAKPCANCPAMVSIPAGSFLEGGWYKVGGSSDAVYRQNEAAARKVNVAAFQMSPYHVTRGEYRRCIASKACPSDVLRRAESWNKTWGYALSDDMPVTHIRRQDAEAYARWISRRAGKKLRLPTAQEWEYAARAGRSGYFYWGNDPRRSCDTANLIDLTWLDFTKRVTGGLPVTLPVAPCHDGFSKLAPVGSLRANEFGLFDIPGNVSEYVQIGGWTGNVEDCALVRGGHFDFSWDLLALSEGRPVGCQVRADSFLMWVGFRLAASE
jgi:formylglycine-generating enzyme required for sulfatase activity